MVAEKAKTSLTLNKELWKSFKMSCVKDEKQYTQMIEQLIEDWLKKEHPDFYKEAKKQKNSNYKKTALITCFVIKV